ncbi:MAG: orotate phosphoribosyltransferase [Brevinematia bacterium]
MDRSRFIEFLIDSEVIRFGEFVTKSGRKTPYFIDFGRYSDGEKLSTLGKFYAEVVNENFPEVTLLFGPAYKGISLSIVTATKLYENYGKNVKVCYNRKEIKDHGEGGIIIGNISQEDKVVIVEDVITSGGSIRESIEILKSNGNPKVLGAVVSVNRMEKGEKEKPAVEEIESEFGIKVVSIVNVYHIIEFLRENRRFPKDMVRAMERHVLANL